MGSPEFVVPLVTGWIGGDVSRFDPRRRATAGATFPVLAWLVRLGGKTVLFDTGAGVPERRLPARPHYTQSPGMAPEVRLVAERGMSLDEIDAVVLSHLHWDHAGGVSAFDPSRVVVQRSEVAFALSPDPANARYYDRAQFAGSDPSRWRAIDGPYRIGSNIAVIPLPGHTPGSQGLLLDIDDGQRLLLVGDALPLWSNLSGGSPRAGQISYNADEARRTVLHIAALDAIALPGHEPLLAVYDGESILGRYEDLRHHSSRTPLPGHGDDDLPQLIPE